MTKESNLKMELTPKYLPLKSFVACAVAMLSYFAADYSQNLTRYNPFNQKSAAYECPSKYPLERRSETEQFIVSKREFLSDETDCFLDSNGLDNLEDKVI